MPKILKPYTIIPPNLYVHRDADRQLENIINDMGRPGYVLVSRQMGKTNLLLNAKREFETNDDIFVYIDLSNPFDTAKSCFENIVDTILEINKEKLQDISKVIKKSRSDSNDLPAHKLHIDELRLILKAITGKLVIILDEIDALTKTNYSDRIFSQIRSIYFSRVNFSEFSRLTYILSGVVEPTEIIKDPKISPFNIGQKIFLNDFSKDEFISFLKQSNLFLTPELSDYIYYWTNGNPRIIWDVCSEIENLLKIREVEKKDIDEVIKSLYLNTFDRPPVDNIREIVKKDVELRNAIIEIEYKKGNVVSDRIKSKLYLTGIINHDNENVKIKNEIIRKALNLDWIKSIEEEEKGLPKIASELFVDGKYAESLETYERFIKNNSFSEAEHSIYFYYMGVSAHKLSQFEKSLDYLGKTNFDKEDDSKYYYLTLNLKGINYYYLNDYSKSLENFKLVLERNKKDEIFARALINFGSICLKANNQEYIHLAKQILNDIIEGESIDATKICQELINELKSIAHFNLAQILVHEKNLELVKKNFYSAISLASLETKPIILMTLFSVLDNKEEQDDVLKSIVNLINNEGVLPKDLDPDKPINFNFEHFKDLLLILYEHKRNTLFQDLKKHLNLLGENKYCKHLFNLAVYSLNKENDLKLANEIFEDLIKNKDNLEYQFDEKIYYSVLRFSAFLSNPISSFDRLVEFAKLFQTVEHDEIGNHEFVIFGNLIHVLYEKKRYLEALNYVEILNNYKSRVSEKYLINFLFIYNLELNIQLALSKFSQAREKAEQILELVNDPKIKLCKSNLLSESGLNIIKQNAESIVNPKRSKSLPVILERKYGRNEIVKVKYKDGSICEQKYKKVMEDIGAGKCVVV